MASLATSELAPKTKTVLPGGLCILCIEKVIRCLWLVVCELQESLPADKNSN